MDRQAADGNPLRAVTHQLVLSNGTVFCSKFLTVCTSQVPSAAFWPMEHFELALVRGITLIG